MPPTNEFGQPVGPSLDGWEPPPFPPAEIIAGELVELVPLDPERHTGPLFDAFRPAPASLWTYMPHGPFPAPSDLDDAIRRLLDFADWRSYAVVVDGDPVGMMSYLRIDPGAGVIEIGSIAFSPRLQRTTAATEALYLAIRNAFDLGYRRCEWKCDDLNEASRHAAVRLGFRYEGTFRKATRYKGRSRDTAWYAITDDEWPPLDAAFRRWLSPANFDAGRQLSSLADLRAASKG